MPPTHTTIASHVVRASAVAAVVAGIVAATWLTASASPPVVPVDFTRLPALSATIESSETAVPVAGDFGYTVHIRLTEPASYLQTRIRVRRPSGRLVFQRTVVDNNLPAGPLDASFGRSLAGLSLAPGAYPVEIEIRADMGGSTLTTDLATSLLIFDPAEKPAGAVLVTRINSQPLEAPDGRFSVDPAVATKARDDVNSIASFILSDPKARLTLSVPPMLLGQWRRTADGYTMSDGRVVDAADPVAISYANVLDLLNQAVLTGRLELLSSGLADPDLVQMATQGLTRDVGLQFQEGRSTTFASLETSPSTGTAPAGSCLPPAALSSLKVLGVGYVVEDIGCARSGESTVTSGAYPIANSSLRAVLSDTIASEALTSAETSVAIDRIAARQIDTPSQPVVVRVELTEGGPGAAETVLHALLLLEREPWARLALGRDATPPSKTREVRLLANKNAAVAPRDYWETVSRSRLFAGALMASLGPSDPDASSAQMDSLIAESSAWSGPDGSWTSADRGLQYAAASLKTSRTILDTVGIKIESITLPSARGTVPVSLQNGTDKTLRVMVRTSTQGGIEVVGRSLTETTMRPQETFIQIPMDMHSALSGKLTVEVLAGTIVLAKQTVDVHASYLDRLAIIGGIVLALAILLAFIVRRVRAAERAEQAEASVRDGHERYTDASADTNRDSEGT